MEYSWFESIICDYFNLEWILLSLIIVFNKCDHYGMVCVRKKLYLHRFTNGRNLGNMINYNQQNQQNQQFLIIGGIIKNVKQTTTNNK